MCNTTEFKYTTGPYAYDGMGNKKKKKPFFTVYTFVCGAPPSPAVLHYAVRAPFFAGISDDSGARRTGGIKHDGENQKKKITSRPPRTVRDHRHCLPKGGE